eukprot:GCRY01001435.1.p1 GENE.GCRY01001435.1~~GCRY01001435.1.p1  ORF type:complete len:550 (-),score=66.80 GCRY01001435.1:167-1816(-)
MSIMSSSRYNNPLHYEGKLDSFFNWLQGKNSVYTKNTRRFGSWQSLIIFTLLFLMVLALIPSMMSKTEDEPQEPVANDVFKDLVKENKDEEEPPAIEPPSNPLETKQAAVREAYLHAWNGYVKHAWGHDEVYPVTNGTNDSWGHLGVTVVDSIDTMMIMQLTEPLSLARTWVEQLSFDVDFDASVFEFAIRYLGGLLSAFDLSADDLYLKKAIELADRLLPAFNTTSGLPNAIVNLHSGESALHQYTHGCAVLSEVYAVQLEFAYLADVSGNRTYQEVVDRINEVIETIAPEDGLFPVFIDANTTSFSSSHITIGALGDSFYELMLKQYIYTKDPRHLDMYARSARGIYQKLVGKSEPNGFTYIGEQSYGVLSGKMDHLVCFAGGMFALGAQYAENEEDFEWQFLLGSELTKTCFETYRRTPSGLGPEISEFGNDDDFTTMAPHYILRPETVESIFVLYRLTGDEMYIDMGWAIFEALQEHCRTPTAYAGLKSVHLNGALKHHDSMQSFFLSETLKYLYLLFSPETLIPLNEYVFTTEAHPLRIPKHAD